MGDQYTRSYNAGWRLACCWWRWLWWWCPA